MTRARVPLLAVALVAAAAGCGDDAEPRPAPALDTPSYAVPDYAADRDLAPGRAALALVPADATTITVTDFDEVRTQLGVPDLTSEDLMRDRSDFWERAPREVVLLAEGMLREDTSELMLDHGFTGDDVDWEARWTGPDGDGWLLAMRPDLDMQAVRGAVDAGVGPLRGGTVEDHLVSSGTGDPAGSWWALPAIHETVVGTETTYLHAGCIPVQEALGVDATYDDQRALLARRDPTALEPLDGLAIGFTGDVATAWLGLDDPERSDLADRASLVVDWPVAGEPGFTDGFTPSAVAQPGSGRLDLDVVDPRAAATLTLTHVLPFGICNEVRPFEEPTGL